MWRNATRNQANATAQIKGALDPIVERVERNLKENYENSLRLEQLFRNVATETQDTKNELQPAVNRILRQQTAQLQPHSCYQPWAITAPAYLTFRTM